MRKLHVLVVGSSPSANSNVIQSFVNPGSISKITMTHSSNSSLTPQILQLASLSIIFTQCDDSFLKSQFSEKDSFILSDLVIIVEPDDEEYDGLSELGKSTWYPSIVASQKPVLILLQNNDNFNSVEDIQVHEFPKTINDSPLLLGAYIFSTKGSETTELPAKLLSIITNYFFVNPVLPLYSNSDRDLTPLALKALNRIYFLDRDIRTKFDPQKQHQHKQGEYDDAIFGFDGFHQEILELILLHRTDEVWKLLKKYRYSNSLYVDFSSEINEMMKMLSGKEDCFMISPYGEKVLKEVFESFDMDKDKLLNPEELQFCWNVGYFMDCDVDSEEDPEDSSEKTMDSKTAVRIPSNRSYIKSYYLPSNNSPIDFAAWMNFLCFVAQLHPTMFFELLLYWNVKLVSETNKNVFVVAKKKLRPFRTGDKTLPGPSTFQCFVFGSIGCGKSSFITRQAVQQKNKHYFDQWPSICCYTTDNPMTASREKQENVCHLILREVKDNAKILIASEEMNNCDLACLLYDGNDAYSFNYISELHTHLRKRNVPCFFVRLKVDLPLVQQYVNDDNKNMPINPKELYTKFKLFDEQICSVENDSNALFKIYNDLTYCAADPSITHDDGADDDTSNRARGFFFNGLLLGFIGDRKSVV